jgi:hypothetical protein
MTTRKTAKAKSGVKKLQIKKETIRDLDVQESAKKVRGGIKPPKGSAAMFGKC